MYISIANWKHLIYIMALLFGLNSIANGQSDDLPDSLQLTEPFEHTHIFDGKIEIGRTHTWFYISGEGLEHLTIKAFNDKKEVLEFRFDEEYQRYIMDYVKLPIIDLTFEGKTVRVVSELVYTDWPGNEINWRMVPLLTFHALDVGN